MARRKIAQKRELIADPIYQDTFVTMFINKLMKGGKKNLAATIFYTAVKIASEELNLNVRLMLDQIMTNVKPAMEIKPYRMGGMNYQVPIEVKGMRSLILTIRYIIKAFRKMRGKPEGFKKVKAKVASIKLAWVLVQSYHGTGPAVAQTEATNKAAESNKAFSHFRWTNR